MHVKRIATAGLIASVALPIGSCVDNATAPEQEIVVPFAISDAQRTELGAALRFAAGDGSLSSFAQRDAAAQQLGAAFARLADRVAQNDRVGARRAIESARAALRAYRELAGSDFAALLEIESLSLALDHAQHLAADAPARSRYISDAVDDSQRSP